MSNPAVTSTPDKAPMNNLHPKRMQEANGVIPQICPAITKHFMKTKDATHLEPCQGMAGHAWVGRDAPAVHLIAAPGHYVGVHAIPALAWLGPHQFFEPYRVVQSPVNHSPLSHSYPMQILPAYFQTVSLCAGTKVSVGVFQIMEAIEGP